MRTRQDVQVLKPISETAGIERLATIRSEFAAEIRANYEYKAKPCSACESPGICCRDEHFVNVHITRLEAAAIRRELARLGDEIQDRVHKRARISIETFELTGQGESFRKTFACPLFERGTGCLVHNSAKPLPCIAHACYEAPADLPPDHLLEERETAIVKLNHRVYGRDIAALPLPLMLARR